MHLSLVLSHLIINFSWNLVFLGLSPSQNILSHAKTIMFDYLIKRRNNIDKGTKPKEMNKINIFVYICILKS